MKTHFILAIASVISLALGPGLAAQTGSITGTVRDAQSTRPLVGASVRVGRTRLVGLSGFDGHFTLLGVSAGEYAIQIERIGYRPTSISVSVSEGRAVHLDVGLEVAPLALDELVVTGTATDTRLRQVGSAVARLRIDEVTDRPGTVSDFLQGQAVGVEVTGGSGEAGQGRQIRLRGNGSMVLSSQPLVYVDGVRIMEGAFPAEVFDGPAAGVPSGANVTTSPLDLVSVGDVERIEVIKGPAATTLYGSGAANGVIQIFTKRGVTGPPRWTAETAQGTGWVRPFGVNGVDYLHIEHFLRDSWWGGGYDGGERSGPCVTDDPRWDGANSTESEGCSWPGSQWYQRYRLAVDGGASRSDYFVSAELQNDSYALPLDELDRYALRSNVGVSLSPRLEMRLQGAYSKLRTSNTASGNSFESILSATMRQERNVLSSADPRDIARLLGNQNRQDVDRLTTGVTTTFTKSAVSTHRLAMGYDFSHQDLASVYLAGSLRAGAALTERTWDRRLVTLDYMGSRRFSRGPLSSTVSVGAQLVTDHIAWRVGSGVDFIEDVPTIPAEGEEFELIEVRDGSYSAGVLAQNLLSVADRYFLTTGLRLDRYGNEGETFLRLDPRIGMAWVASDESFWPVSGGVLRLRAAYGHSSTAPSPFVQALEYFGGDPPDEAEPGGVLEPEANREVEVGLDAALLDGRLTLGFTGYWQATTNALVRVTVDGESLPRRVELRNVGELHNRGVELQLDGEIVRGADWSLDMGIGVTTNHSEVRSLGSSEAVSDGLTRFEVGFPGPLSRGRRVADPQAVNGAWSDDRYVTDGEGSALLPLGSQLPTHVLTPSVSVRLPAGVALDARGEYRGGHVRFVNPVPVSRQVRSPLCEPYYSNPVDPTDPSGSIALRPDTPDLWRERCTAAAADDYWFDAAYFKLRSVTATVPVGFAFPESVDAALLTLTLVNAYTWYREVPWWDVEIPGNDGANGDGVGTSDRVPAPATISLALRVVF